jgi:hypothetical protein
MRAEEGRVLTRPEAVLAALFPFVALSLLNHFYKAWVFDLGPAWFWLADAVQYLVAPAAGWYFFLRPAGVKPSDYGLKYGRNSHDRHGGIAFTLFIALLLVAAYWPIHTVANALLAKFSGNFQDVNPKSGTYFASLIVALYMSATAALVEEGVWRGLSWLYLSAVLPLRWRRFWYVLITATVFAIAHSEQGPGGVMAAFWFGVLAAGLYLKLKTLWPVVLGHFITDLLIFGPWR